MTAPKFSEGDTVRVLNTHPEVLLRGKTGEVLGRTDSSARYVRVQVRSGRVEWLLDTEMELVQ